MTGGKRIPVLNLSVMNPIGSIYPQPYVGPPGQVIVPGVGVMIGAPTAKSEKWLVINVHINAPEIVQVVTSI